MTLLANASHWLGQLKQALSGTREKMMPEATGDLPETDRQPFHLQDALDALESSLLRADVGLETTDAILNDLRTRQNRLTSHPALRRELRDVLAALLGDAVPLQRSENGLSVILMVGVNGSGKTTTIGKLAHRFKSQGHSVILGAGDTYRAAAQEQLAVWAERTGCPIIQKKPGSDPAAVVFETIRTALNTQAQIAIIDTAGRLQSKSNLMQELTKVRTAVDKALGEHKAQATVEVLLVLDAITGQNALQQAEGFLAATGLTGVVLTKLDGSAKGGVVFAIRHRYQLPVKLVGLGEGLDDLADFDPALFVEAL